jgi:hypothetical protein
VVVRGAVGFDVDEEAAMRGGGVPPPPSAIVYKFLSFYTQSLTQISAQLMDIVFPNSFFSISLTF